MAISMIGSFSVSAQQVTFMYTEGTLKGTPVQHSGYLGYEPACFVGSVWRAKAVLNNMVADDIEKADVAIWHDNVSKTISFKFVDTKCTDDSENATAADCTNVVQIPQCK